MFYVKLQILFQNIQGKKWWMHRNISNTDGFKLERLSVHMVY